MSDIEERVARLEQEGDRQRKQLNWAVGQINWLLRMVKKILEYLGLRADSTNE